MLFKFNLLYKNKKNSVGIDFLRNLWIQPYRKLLNIDLLP